MNDGNSKNESGPRRLPPWLRKKISGSGAVLDLKKRLADEKLHTVCQSAGCPNLSECFGRSTATFLILGDACTRTCGFCGVRKGVPGPPDSEEPERVAEEVRELGLGHAVVTSVTRDDLDDGGAAHFAQTVSAIRRLSPGTTVEVLIPDFQGSPASLRTVLESGVDVLNHNVETVPRLYPRVRPGADFERSLGILRAARELRPQAVRKSGLMVGLGEEAGELDDAFRRLAEAGCQVLTLGQYLPPSTAAISVHRFVLPDEFDGLAERAKTAGIQAVLAGSFVRSSYKAGEMLEAIRRASPAGGRLPFKS